MTLFKNKYRIEPNRWQMWDYSAPASYFITVCIDDGKEILGQINDGKMNLSENGEIVAEHFVKIPEYNKRIILDEWVIMPNHIHCIITLGDYDNGIFENNNDDMGGNSDNDDSGGSVEKIHVEKIHVEKIHEFSLPPHPPHNHPMPAAPTPDDIKQYRKMRRRMLIPMIMGKFQMQASKQINILNNTPGQRTWQRDYHDHVIRNEREYWRIKNYIINNPKNWDKDKFNENSGK